MRGIWGDQLANFGSRADGDSVKGGSRGSRFFPEAEARSYFEGKIKSTWWVTHRVGRKELGMTLFF